MQRPPANIRSLLLIVAVLVCPWTGHAEEGEAAFRAGADVGLGNVDEDGFVSLVPRLGLAWRWFEVDLAGPVRLRFLDRSPEDAGVLRAADWDEASDYPGRIIQKLGFATTGDDSSLALEIGHLDGIAVGHGSVLDLYFNNLDIDHAQAGALAQGDLQGNGAELLVENVVEPEILVGRVFLAPLGWFLDGEWPRRLELGATVGADLFAPRRIIATTPTRMLVAGGDLALTLFDNDVIELTPYADINVLDGDAGVHAGLDTRLVFSESKAVRLAVKGEWRYVGSDYQPTLFGPFHEVNRRAFGIDPETGSTRTLADALALARPDPSQGFMIDVGFAALDAFHLGARYDFAGVDRPHWLLLRADFSWQETLSLAAFYAGQDLDGGGDLLSRDALLGLEARYRVIGPLEAFALWARRFARQDTEIVWMDETAAGLGLFAAW